MGKFSLFVLVHIANSVCKCSVFHTIGKFINVLTVVKLQVLPVLFKYVKNLIEKKDTINVTHVTLLALQASSDKPN